MGHVYVTNDASNITVTFVLDAGWVLVETHVTFSGIPQVNGNPPPGQFPYSGNPVTIPNTWAPGTDLIIAAHAVVQQIIGSGSASFASGVNTDAVLYLAEGTPGYPVGYTAPFQSYIGSTVPSVTCWEAGVWPQIAGADWISNNEYDALPTTPPPFDSDYNTWRLFTRSFTLPTNAINISGQLVMDCDNAELVYLNNTYVGEDTYAPATIVYGASVKDVSPPVGDAHGWSSIESWGVSSKLKPGINNLWTMTRNYAWSGGPTANPTGLIYKLCADYDLVGLAKTAWAADGTVLTHPFPGKNWATYFHYKVQGSIAGNWVITFYLTGDLVNGYSHDATFTQSGGTITGVGGGYESKGAGYQPLVLPLYTYAWVVDSGSITGATINPITCHYIVGQPVTTIMHISGTITDATHMSIFNDVFKAMLSVMPDEWFATLKVNRATSFFIK